MNPPGGRSCRHSCGMRIETLRKKREKSAFPSDQVVESVRQLGDSRSALNYLATCIEDLCNGECVQRRGVVGLTHGSGGPFVISGIRPGRTLCDETFGAISCRRLES